MTPSPPQLPSYTDSPRPLSAQPGNYQQMFNCNSLGVSVHTGGVVAEVGAAEVGDVGRAGLHGPRDAVSVI